MGTAKALVRNCRWEPRRQRLRSQIPPADLPFTQKSARTWADFAWRYRWDLNPRCVCTHTTFRELHLRPLGHDTEIKITSYLLATEIVDYRWFLKNSLKIAPHSSAKTPETTSGRWGNLRSRTTSQSDPTAPAFSSKAPKTMRPIRA